MRFLFIAAFILGGLLPSGCQPSSHEQRPSAMVAEKEQRVTVRGIVSRSGHHLDDQRRRELLARPIPGVGSESELSDEDFERFLTPQEFEILRREGTEVAFTGEYNTFDEKGTYHCRGCNAPLFSSDTKFASRSGWPSFYSPMEGRVARKRDESHGMIRTEVHCAHCKSHLGHVFEDGPEPTGLRYCVNAMSIVFHGEDENFTPSAPP